ncbi:MAG TPA: alpha/beta fold hydrolase [Thermoanaerobaculia bacterium]|jgi:esterase/lipase superfamily enzyme|nr:alpha/beta fold hydrolase [Thermoanaerobaculia bacterium]
MWRYFLIVGLVTSSLFAGVPRKVQGVEQSGPSFRVTVYYATDRVATADKPPLSPYGSARSKELAYGAAHVSIPSSHTIGVIEEATKWKFQFSPDVTRDVVFLDTTSMTSDAFFKTMKQQTAASSSSVRSHSALILIHGFWTNFDEAIRRAAQTKYDIGFDGPVIVYTWPSYGDGVFYAADENNAEWTVHHLRLFLSDFSTLVGAQTDIIAHSMGNRILAHALESEAERCPLPVVHLDQIILAAPDMDRETFLGIAETITPLAKRITVYASRHDQALAISHSLHQGSRAGEAGPEIVVLPRVETIDVGEVDQSFRGHSYVFENVTVLSDISAALRGKAIGIVRCGFVSQTLQTLSYFTMVRPAMGIKSPCVVRPAIVTSNPAGSPAPASRTASRSPSSR